MGNPASVLVSCDSPNEIVAATNAAVVKLPLEIRRAFNDIFSEYLFTFGLKGVYERFNNRSVEQIFAEYQPGSAQAIESKELEGVRYTLYEAPHESDGPRN